MAIFGSVFALLGRFAGRVLNSALGWATLLLFGKVEGRNQSVLLVIALGSLVWVLAIVGVLIPDVGTFLLAFVPVPDFIDENVVRLAMVGVVVVIPLLIGAAALFIADPVARPQRLNLAGGVLRGYPFTLVLAITILVLGAVSVVRKVRSLAKRWEDAHVPMIVKPNGYDTVLADLEGVLRRAGLPVEPRPAPSVVSLPPRLLDAVAGRALGALVPDKLMLLHAPDVEVLVYPSDVAISGSRGAVARARAAIAAQLTRSPAYMTASAEAQRIEDEVQALAEGSARRGAADWSALRERLADIDRRLVTLTVPFDEWETVYRERLQVERDALIRQLGGIAVVDEGAGELMPDAARPGSVEWAVAAVGLALLAADVLLLVRSRSTTHRRP